MPPGGLHIRWPDHALDQEARLFDYKWYAALAYIRANRLNHNVIEGPNDRFGIIASGKAYNDTRQALIDLGLDDATCRRWASGCTRWPWCGRWKRRSRATSPPACRKSWSSRRSARSSNTS
jgi:TPP-dependent indolepyruvate ferredoxin oxidoreductase alpha subunit